MSAPDTTAIAFTLPDEPVTRSLTWAMVRTWLAANGWVAGGVEVASGVRWQRADRVVYTYDMNEPEDFAIVVRLLAQIDRVPAGIMLARIADADSPEHTREEFAAAAGEAHRHLHEWIKADAAKDAGAARASVIAAHTALHHVGGASPSPGPSPLTALLRDLRDVGTRAIEHDRCGGCPDAIDDDRPAMRDPKCPACRVLLRADEALDGRILDAGGDADDRTAFLREALAATVADCARLRSDLTAETATRQQLRAQEATVYWLLAEARDVPTDPVAGVAKLVEQRNAARQRVDYFVSREDTIVRALAPVSDGGQYRADIVRAIGRVVAERDELREDLRGALMLRDQLHRERAEMANEHAEALSTLRLLVVAAGVAMRKRAAEECEREALDNYDDDSEGHRACLRCANGILRLPEVPAAKP